MLAVLILHMFLINTVHLHCRTASTIKTHQMALTSSSVVAGREPTAKEDPLAAPAACCFALPFTIGPMSAGRCVCTFCCCCGACGCCFCSWSCFSTASCSLALSAGSCVLFTFFRNFSSFFCSFVTAFASTAPYTAPAVPAANPSAALCFFRASC